MARLFLRNPIRSNKNSDSSRLNFEAVEPRVLFSATAIDPSAENVDSHHDLPQTQEVAAAGYAESNTASSEEVASPHAAEDVILEGLNLNAADIDTRESKEIVFLSAGVFDQNYLANHLDPAYEIYLIEPGSDAVAQIAQTLQGMNDVDAIHLIGHGEEGRLYLGDTVLDAESMGGAHREWLENIGQSLSTDADILIYGCDFTGNATGLETAALLSSITGADVAASTDKTGHDDLGGDWMLETEVGAIEANALALGEWEGLLAPPSVTAPTKEVMTLEDAPLTFSGANQIEVDSETHPELTVTLSVGQGTLTLSGIHGLTFLGGTKNGDSVLEFSGDIADLNAALDGLVYTPDQDSFGSETLSITVDDGEDFNSADVAIAVVSQNDAPVLVVNPVNASGTGTPSETTPHTFTLADFEAVDPDNSNNQLTYILNSLPTVGHLRLHGYPVAVGTVFTQSDLASGALVYTHDGGETHSDSFTLTVNDGAGGSDALVSIPITITATNDHMSVVTDALVYEGGSTRDSSISPSKPTPVLSLGISDVEADLKSVRITSLPGGGTLYFNGSPLTQAVINNGFTISASQFNQLEYRHDGVDDLGTGASDRSFTMTVTDLGGGAGLIETVNHTVNIRVVSVNDDLELVTLSTAIPTITSGGSYVLGLSDMEVHDPDGPDQQLTYTLASTPLLGTLLINGTPSGAGSIFTQAQLATGQVVFTNPGAEALESLTFTVTDSQISILTDELGTLREGDLHSPARVLQLRFNLTVPEEGTGTNPEDGESGFSSRILVPEGGGAVISDLVPGDVFRLTSPPTHGVISVNGVPLAAGVPHTYAAGDVVTYQHDGSHGSSDTVGLILNGSPESVPVIVVLTNDAPLLTIVAPVTHIREGFSGTITTSHLQVVDEETTDPALLIYTVIASPTAGRLFLNGNMIPDFGSFTHQDVIDGRLSYSHDGNEKFLDRIELRVTDGGATDTGALQIEIIPVNDQPSVNSSFIELREGGLKSFSASALGISDTDGNDADIPLSPDSPLQIRIDTLPASGTLLYNDPVSGMTAVTTGFTFAHSDIGRLHYQHDSSETFDDTFNFTVLDNNTYTNPGFDAPGTRAGTMTIEIIPVNDAPEVTTNAGLINDGAGDRRLYEGGTRVITLGVLDSSDPDSSDEQVQYLITVPPGNGTLLYNGNPISAGTAFSQEDLSSGRISYRHDGSETTTDQFTFRIDDGSSNVREEVFLIEVIEVNDAPEIAASSSTTMNTADYHFTGGRTISIGDDDARTGDVTVTLTVNDPGGLLRVTSSIGLTSITGNDTSNQIVLVGEVSEINAALATLHYRSTDLDAATTLTIHVNDGGNTGMDPSQVPAGEIIGLVNTGTNSDEQATRIVTLFVSPLNDAPVNQVPAAQTTHEDVTLVFNSTKGNAITVSDVDAFSSDMQVSLSVANGTLTLGSTTGLTFISGDGTSDTSMTFRGTIAEINAALEGLRYLGNSNYSGPDSLQLTTHDLGNTGDGAPLTASSTVGITVLPVNDAPTIAGPGSLVTVNAATFAFTGGNTISVNDLDIGSGLATVTLTVNDLGGVLEVTQLTGLSAITGNGTSNVLTFSGTQSDINAALATLAYSPTDVDGPATLSVLVSDNGNTGVDPSSIGLAHTGTTTDEQATRVFGLQVSDINDAPVNSVPSNQTFDEDAGRIFSTANGNAISIADVDAFNFDVTTTVSVASGTLTAGGTSGQRAALTSLVGSGTNTLVLTGTVAEINAVLQGLAYSSPLNYNGSDTLTITTNDKGNTGAGGPLEKIDTVGLTISPVNDAPVNTKPSARNVNEDTALVFSTANGNAIAVSDVDVNEGTGLLTVTLGVSNGTLTLSGISGLNFANGDGSGDSTMTFTGTVADINAALQGMAFNPVADYNGPAELTLTTNDKGNFGSGGARNDTDTVDITVSPVVDIVADSVTTAEDTAISINVITGTNGASADHFEGTPVLTAINGTAVIAGSEVSVSNGKVTVDATTGLLTFRPNAHFNGSTSFNYTVTSPTGVTESTSVTVNVTPVNDAPVNSVPSNQTFDEDAGRVFSTANGNAISISDIDAATGDVTTTVSVASGTLTAGGTSGQRAALTSLVGSGTNTLVLTGTVAEINAVLQGLAYSSPLNDNGSDTLTITTKDKGNTGAGGPLEKIDTVGLTISPVNDAPVNTKPSARNVNEDTALIFSTANGNAIAVSDVDVNEGTGLLTVTLGVSNGTLTLSGISGLDFATGDGSGDSTMTFTGTVADINAALQGMVFNPVADYNGPAVLTLTTNDKGNFGSGGARNDTDTVEITVSPVGDIVADSVTTAEDTPISINVITGTNGASADHFEGTPVLTAINGTTVTAGSEVSVSNGKVTVDATTGLLTFKPDLNYNGTTSFNYTVTSPTGVTESTSVTVNVTPINDDPVNTTPAAQNVGEDGKLIFSAANGNAISVSDLDAAEGSGLVTLTLEVTNGSLTLGKTSGLLFATGDGTGDATLTFTGTVTDVNAALDGMSYQPVPDYNGPASLTLTTQDNGSFASGGPRTDTDKVNITVTPVVDIVADSVTTAEDTPISINVITGTNGASADHFEGTPVLTAINGTAVTAGSEVSVSNGKVTVDATTGLLTFKPDLNYNGSTSFNYTVTSPTGVTESTSVTVNVTPVNDDPVNTTPAAQNVGEDGKLVFSAANGNAISVSDLDAAEGSGLVTLTLEVTNGTLTLGKTSGLLFATGDGTGDATLTFTGTVTDVNAALDGMSYLPVPDYNGPDSLTLTTSDNGNVGTGGQRTDTDTVGLTVTPVVDIVADSVTTAEDTPISINVITGTNGASADHFEGTPVLTAINGTAVTAGSEVSVSNGKVTVDATTGLLTFKPDLNYNGTTSFNYTVTSPTGVTETAQVTVEVTPVNDDPFPIGSIPDQIDEDSDLVSLDVTGFFDDLEVTDVLTYTATNLPPGLSIDRDSGIISGEIDSSASSGGPYTVIISATDGHGGTPATQTLIWTVTNPGPIAVDDFFGATQDDRPSIVGNAITNNDSDPDGDALTTVVQTGVTGTGGGLFSIDKNGNVTFDPDNRFNGLSGGEFRDTSFTYTLVDADGKTSTATVTVRVAGVNAPPKPDSGKITVSVGSNGGKLGLDAPSDPDGDRLTIKVTRLPAVGTLRLPNGKPVKVGQQLTANQLEKLVYDAPANYRGDRPVLFRYSVTDGQYTSHAKVEISIVRKNQCCCEAFFFKAGNHKKSMKSFTWAEGPSTLTKHR